MDAFKPFLGPIVRLDVAHKSAFHVAGVQHYKIEKVKKDQKTDVELIHQTAEHKKIKEDDDEKDEEEKSHEEHKGENLDTWA
ncbi:hypothetical protein [Pseudoalteromonas peptidolytica]|uniref:Uncharacterized protein n=1 Tax=Pseudoalteromonas peptidolytica F12-50-A1 TaxID=1315280 RepID=A0A8I0T800_9GAMM|nr:hypothetical protein [Pseudoalteromonas peptidolytica]MBE0348769.1 hypothetical protein [Pseudoalteromonas peptidolytica F12-50-A1]NLR15076.1 hypothetical protein [Pseudoalteromonas peptidolytica]GEK09378.1 hypothetical protein PPE03_16270 [Pseudoalteromonas peptidolytica]